MTRTEAAGAGTTSSRSTTHVSMWSKARAWRADNWAISTSRALDKTVWPVVSNDMNPRMEEQRGGGREVQRQTRRPALWKAGMSGTVKTGSWATLAGAESEAGENAGELCHVYVAFFIGMLVVVAI